MRFVVPLLLAATLAAPAQAQTRVIAQANGWIAFGGTTPGGLATCGLETRHSGSGRHFLLQHLAGQDRPVMRLSRPGWNLRASTTQPVRIVIDNRRVFAATATGAGQEMSFPLAIEGPNGFEQSFRRGALIRVEFPGGPDTPWDLSLTGTNLVMGAFVGCMRMMAIQPGEAPPLEAPPVEPPAPLAPPPAMAPLPDPVAPPAPMAAPPAAAPARPGLPEDKPGPAAKPAPGVKPVSQGSITQL